MKRNLRRQHLQAEINITPFTDVILVLLIIFMITTPLITESNIKVNLPQAKSGSPAETHVTRAEISISREGLVYLGSKLVTRHELREKIKQMHKSNPDLIVVVRSDKMVRFQEIVDVLDPLSEMGITRLNIAATNE